MWPFTKKTKKKETVVEKKETEEKAFEEKKISNLMLQEIESI